MSNFMKQGYRKHKITEIKKLDKSLKDWYKRIEDIKDIAKDIVNNHQLTPEDINEDNINNYTKPYFNRDLDDMEKLFFLGLITDMLQKDVKDK